MGICPGWAEARPVRGMFFVWEENPARTVTKGAENTMGTQGFQGTGEYVASEELMASVNIAIALKKPLLIKGEPGTGKTMLAEAVAKALGKRLIIWNIKSTTKAQEGLYVYDTIQRLYDGQFGEIGRAHV